MEVKSLLLVVFMLYIVDVSNAVMCYNCTSMENPACGPTISGSSVQMADCTGQCQVAKTSMSIADTVMEVYTRTCEEYCLEACMNMEGITTCSTCCSDQDGCNGEYVDQGPPPTPVAGLMCYNCTSVEPACGATLGDTSSLQTTPCSGTCTVSKTTMDIQGSPREIYQRSCQPFCLSSTCMDIPEVEGMSICSSCCSDTTLCNADYVDSSQTGGVPGQPEPEPGTPAPGSPDKGATPPPDNDVGGKGDKQPNEGAQGATANPIVQDGGSMTTKSSAINVVVNVATIFFTYLLSTTMF